MTSIVCTLELIRYPIDPDDFLGVICPDCRGHVVMYQPDERRPDRLLGACGSCSAWFLMAPAAAAMVRLPDDKALGGCQAAPAQPGAAALVVQHGE
jgi:hypothetical protein